jgi:hypothetical protein
MHGAPMVNERVDASPRFQARMAGAIALATTTSGFAVFVRGKLLILDDAATTAHNILANEFLFRLAVVGDLIALLYVAYTLVLYNVLKPVNKSISLLAACFSLAGCAVAAILCLLEVAPLAILQGAASPSGFTSGQRQDLALTFLRLHSDGYTISMVLFGTYNLLVGYLIARSTFLPRIVGLLLGLSGVCYLFNSFAYFLAPTFAARLLPYILIPGASELVLALWLLVFGVNVQRWHEMAAALA